MKIQIATIDELSSVLGRAYFVETQLELSIQWEAYMVVKNKYRDVLFTISHDSEIHKSMLKKMFDKIEGMNLEEALKEFVGKEFNPKNLHDEEILTEVMKKELLALDVYKRLHDYSSQDFIKKHWKGRDYKTYFKNLKWLMKQEEKHIEILKPYSGQIERIL